MTPEASQPEVQVAVDAGVLQLPLRQHARWEAVALGEVMLRFDPGEERISATRHFRVWEGGGEYNVMRGLRRAFGLRTSIVTALVDNPVGRLLEDLLLQGGVDLSHVQWQPFDGIGRAARNGVYFLERGEGVRPGLGMMDRGHTAIAQLRATDVDWQALFGEEGVRWFHTGGILCGLSPESPALAEAAMRAAREHGTLVSFDCNYRPSLWKDAGGREAAVRVNRQLLPYVDVLFGHEGDIAAVLGEASHRPPWHDRDSYAAMAARITTEFPHLRAIATTVRRAHTADRNDWGAFGYAAGQVHETRLYRDLKILDRVGAGDSFASGVIYGLLAGRGLGWALECGTAHGALTMTTPGDSSQVRLAEIEHLMAGHGANVNR